MAVVVGGAAFRFVIKLGIACTRPAQEMCVCATQSTHRPHIELINLNEPLVINRDKFCDNLV